MRSWIVKEGSDYVAPAGNTPWANGKAVLRNLGIRGQVDLIEAQEGKTVATFQVLPMKDKGLGYVVYTPDGYWDGSAGVEALLAVFDGERLLDGEGKLARRNPGVIEGRLRGLWK